MAGEITHRADPETGRMVQLVSAKRLRQILRQHGETYERPRDFRAGDEWDVNPSRRARYGGEMGS